MSSGQTQIAEETTLLELVRAIAETGASDRELVATVTELVASGRVRLVGNFRCDDLTAPDAPPRESRSAA